MPAGRNITRIVFLKSATRRRFGNLLAGSLDWSRRPAERHDCYGCQRLDILTALQVCGS